MARTTAICTTSHAVGRASVLAAVTVKVHWLWSLRKRQSVKVDDRVGRVVNTDIGGGIGRRVATALWSLVKDGPGLVRLDVKIIREYGSIWVQVDGVVIVVDTTAK